MNDKREREREREQGEVSYSIDSKSAFCAWIEEINKPIHYVWISFNSIPSWFGNSSANGLIEHPVYESEGEMNVVDDLDTWFELE